MNGEHVNVPGLAEGPSGMGIRSKLVLSIGLLFVLALGAVEAVGVLGVPFTPLEGRLARQRHEIFLGLNQLADQKEARLARWLLERKADCRMAAGNELVSEVVERMVRAVAELRRRGLDGAELARALEDVEGRQRLRAYFARMLQAYGMYAGVEVADALDGRVLVSIDPARTGAEIKERDYFQGALLARSLFVGELEPGDGGRPPLLNLGDLVLDKAGQPLAVLVLAINAEDVIKPLIQDRSDMAQAAEALLVNQDGLLLTSLEHPLADGGRAEPLRTRITSLPEALAASGEMGMVEADDYRGVPVLAAYRHLRISARQGWGLVVKRDRRDLYQPLREEIGRSLVLGLAGLIILLAVTVLWMDRLTRPIASLSRTAQRVGQGDLGARAEVTTSDEIGHLARTFNTMVGHLQGWQQNLEREVRARTAELNERNQRLTEEVVERQRAEGALRLSEERFRAIFEQAAVGVAVLDSASGTYMRVNQRYADITGYSRQELLGMTFHDITHPDDLAKDQENMARLVAGEIASFNIEKRYRRRDGSEVWGDLTVSALEAPGQGPRGHLAVLIDIDERKRAQAERDRLEERLRQSQKMEAIGTLAGGIAHDFNNILGAINGYAELALDDARHGRGSPAELEAVLKSVARAKGLVDQILTFSRQRQAELEPLDLNDQIGQAMELIGRTIPRMIRVELRLAPDLRPIRGDRNQIEQVLMNLCVNARDAMPEGGRLTIETANLPPDGQGPAAGPWVALIVSDSGEGMDEATRAKVFDPFFTTKDVGKGTGLGLSTVYGIVKEHGGVISCASQPGRGAVFRVLFPALGPGAASGPQEDTPSPPPPASPPDRQANPGEARTILVVDDEPGLRQIGRTILERHGYRVVLAGTGEEALELYRQRGQELDLVLLDLSMPGMGGMQCLRELIRLNPAVKVVVASGYARDAELADTLEAGASEFVSKPFMMSALLDAVRRTLEGQTRSRE